MNHGEVVVNVGEVQGAQMILDSNIGKLDTLIDKWTTKALGWRNPLEWHNAKYKLVIIAACAMMMGCTLKQEFIDCLKEIFTKGTT